MERIKRKLNKKVNVTQMSNSITTKLFPMSIRINRIICYVQMPKHPKCMLKTKRKLNKKLQGTTPLLLPKRMILITKTIDLILPKKNCVNAQNCVQNVQKCSKSFTILKILFLRYSSNKNSKKSYKSF